MAWRRAPGGMLAQGRTVSRCGDPGRCPLLRVGLGLARPDAGDAMEGVGPGAVDPGAHPGEDRALERRRSEHLRQRRVLGRGLRRFLLVAPPPDEVDELAADQPGENAHHDADGLVEKFHREQFCPSGRRSILVLRRTLRWKTSATVTRATHKSFSGAPFSTPTRRPPWR